MINFLKFNQNQCNGSVAFNKYFNPELRALKLKRHSGDKDKMVSRFIYMGMGGSDEDSKVSSCNPRNMIKSMKDMIIVLVS